MNDIKIIINDEVCDLGTTNITLNDVKYNVGDITLRNTPFTYSIKLPKTKKNNEIFKKINVLDIIGKFSKDFKVEIYFQDDLILTGNVFINNIDKNDYNINIISNDLDWTKDLAKKTLNDLNLTEEFSAIWNNSNSILADGTDYESFITSTDKKMNFPLIGYGNFFQTYDVGVFQLFANGFLSGQLGKGLYITDDEIPFYIDDRNTLLPSATFADGTVFKLKGSSQDYQVKVIEPQDDNYIGNTNFTHEEYPPSFYINPILKNIFETNGLKVSFDCFEKTKDYLMPFVGSNVRWNYGLLAQYNATNNINPRITPNLTTKTLLDVDDNVSLEIQDIFHALGNHTGIYRDSIGSEPCSQWTKNPAYVSDYDNYKDGVFTVESVPAFESWFGYLFFLNNVTKNFDYTQNYRKYNGLYSKNNFTVGSNNSGHFYRTPVKTKIDYHINFDVTALTYSWNPSKFSKKLVGDELPFYFLIVKNEDFKDNIERLYNGQAFNDNVLYSQNLLNGSFAVVDTTYTIDIELDLEKDDTITACFVSYQQSSVDLRKTGNHFYQPIGVTNVNIGINPQWESIFDIAVNLPNINQLEFVKEYMKLNNLFPIVDKNKIYFKSFDKYLFEPNIDLTNKATYSSIEKIDVYDTINYKYTQDRNDYLITDEDRNEAIAIDFSNMEKKVLDKTQKEYNFLSIFSPTHTRTYQVLNAGGGIVEIDLPSLTNQEMYDTDPRFVNTTFNFNYRILKYTGQTTRKIKIMDEFVFFGQSIFPNELYMNEVYKNKYYKIIEKNNLSHVLELDLFLDYKDYKLFKNNLVIVNYMNDKYYVIEIKYNLINKKSQISLLKKL